MNGLLCDHVLHFFTILQEGEELANTPPIQRFHDNLVDILGTELADACMESVLSRYGYLNIKSLDFK